MGREIYLVDKENKKYWYLGKGIQEENLEIMNDEEFNNSFNDPRPNHPENVDMRPSELALGYKASSEMLEFLGFTKTKKASEIKVDAEKDGTVYKGLMVIPESFVQYARSSATGPAVNFKVSFDITCDYLVKIY